LNEQTVQFGLLTGQLLINAAQRFGEYRNFQVRIAQGVCGVVALGRGGSLFLGQFVDLNADLFELLLGLSFLHAVLVAGLLRMGADGKKPTQEQSSRSSGAHQEKQKSANKINQN